MYNTGPNNPRGEAADTPDAPVPYSTCFLCGAADNGNLHCPACREVMRQQFSAAQHLDILDGIQKRKQGAFAEGAGGEVQR